MNHLLSLTDAATKWQQTERIVRQWCQNGDISAVRINNEWVIDGDQQPSILTLKEFNLNGLEKAVEAFNNRYDYARIYFDLDNLFVWTAYYITEEEMDYFGCYQYKKFTIKSSAMIIAVK